MLRAAKLSALCNQSLLQVAAQAGRRVVGPITEVGVDNLRSPTAFKVVLCQKSCVALHAGACTSQQ